MRPFVPIAIIILSSSRLGAGPDPGSPLRFASYYSGPPCPISQADRTFSQFQVNLSPEEGALSGDLVADENGEALLARDGQPPVRLVTNASRADWLLSYPLLMNEVGILGHGILRPDCSTDAESFYVEAIFPPVLLQGRIDPRVDLMERQGVEPLQGAVLRYRRELSRGMRSPKAAEDSQPGMLRAAGDLAEELFVPDASMALQPWRVRLMGGDEELPASDTVEILLSGSDGAVGVFGHIAAGGGGTVYNVYPKGSDRGAPGPVDLADYLFNAERGHALRRPTWILRLEGLPEEVVSAFHRDISALVNELDEGRVPYHPTANNCTIVSLKALGHLGFEVAKARYFTRRFPRPAFTKILSDLPGRIAVGRLGARRVELIYVPQVPTRPAVGGAPNRPLRDRSKTG
jgi:hypothetical protein